MFAQAPSSSGGGVQQGIFWFFLVVAAVALLAVVIAFALMAVGSPALAQPDGSSPPRERRQRGVRIDPQHDETVQAIRAAVEPTEQQAAEILALYTKLRRDQRTLMRDALAAVRGDDGSRDGGRQFDREQMWQAREMAGEMIESLNEGFLEACRGLLRADQHDAWDACASGLDLQPRRRRGGGRGRRDRGGGPDPGEAAPAFELTNLTGETVTLESLRGRPVVVEFGSYTCPVFRRQVEPVEQLRRHFGDDVHWVLIYTKEAHPTDGWVAPVNTRQGIEVPQHVSFEKRMETARLCRDAMTLKVNVLVDGLDNKITEAYAGHPNRGYVVDAEGKVVSRQAWIDPQETRRVLEKLLGTG